MSYAFTVVVTVAITLKLLFMSFSLYYTLKNKLHAEEQQTNMTTKKSNKSLALSWKTLPKVFLPKGIYCPEGNNKIFANKL